MSTKMRGIVVFLAALVCFALLFSCFFMAYQVGHICCNDRCAICCLVSAYQNLLKSLATVLLVLAIVMGAVRAVWFIGFDVLFCFVRPSLVAQKVKLSN